MADDAAPFSLKRWSQRKLETRRQSAPNVVVPAATPHQEQVVAGSKAAVESATPAAVSESAAVGAAPESATAATAPDLPPIESLSLESDFSAFLRPDVDADVRRQALKKLFSDPHFNVMDGLDVYIADYSLPDPIAPDIVRGLMQSRFILDPPKTRVNAQGYVEDIPPEELPQTEADASAAPVTEEGAVAQGSGVSTASMPTTQAQSAAPDVPVVAPDVQGGQVMSAARPPEGANCTPFGGSERSERGGSS